MQVKRLTLRNFRNIRDCTFEPDPRLNFLFGANGQGKTSFIEALGFLATLRSFRGSKAAEVIQWGASSSEIRCTLVPGSSEAGANDWETELKLSFILDEQASQKATKVAFINGKAYRSSTQFLSQRFGNFELGFHAVVFNPSDHDLVRGEPGIRRSYLDRVLAAEDVEYLKIIQKYQRVLQQRNALLKASEKPSSEVLAGFTEPMGQFAAYLTFKRLQWIERVGTHLNSIVHQIAPEEPELRVVYHSNWAPFVDGLSYDNKDLSVIHFAGQGHLPSLELIEQAFSKKLSSLESAEWRAGHSLVGPHRDDWAFYLGNRALKGHGSQGEVRSALMALKLSEIELFREETGHRPLFLLDDFSSELDRERRSFLLKFLSDTDLQVFVTTTDASVFAGKRFWVMEGNLKEGSHDGAETTQPK